MSNKRNLTIVIGTLILSLAVAIGARPSAQEVTLERDSQLRIVRVAAVERTANTREIRLPGVTRSLQRANLAFTIPARIAERPVEVGDRVQAGQIVAMLDTAEFTLAERSANAVLAELDVRLDQARRDEARVSQLAEARAATAEELEKIQAGTAMVSAARDAASARAEDMRRLLKEATLRAPFDGTVTSVKLEPGEWAAPGKTVVELAGSNAIEVRVEVPESVRPLVISGSVVHVDLPMLSKSASGRISSVANAASGSGALFPVVVALDSSEDLVAGLAAEVVVSLEAVPELSVPLSAVLDSGSSRPSVFRITDGRAERISINPGHVSGDRLTVTAEDLVEGDSVAVVGHTALVDGDAVEVR